MAIKIPNPARRVDFTRNDFPDTEILHNVIVICEDGNHIIKTMYRIHTQKMCFLNLTSPLKHAF